MVTIRSLQQEATTLNNAVQLFEQRDFKQRQELDKAHIALRELKAALDDAEDRANKLEEPARQCKSMRLQLQQAMADVARQRDVVNVLQQQKLEMKAELDSKAQLIRHLQTKLGTR